MEETHYMLMHILKTLTNKFDMLRTPIACMADTEAKLSAELQTVPADELLKIAMASEFPDEGEAMDTSNEPVSMCVCVCV